MEDIEDYYVFYVLILGIPENIFWNFDISFVLNVADNKSAYENWLSSEKEKQRQRELNRKKR